MDQLIKKKSVEKNVNTVTEQSTVCQLICHLGPLLVTTDWESPEPMPYLSQKLLWLTGPLSAGTSATCSPEPFHCSTEQQLPIATDIDFHS